MEKRSCSFFDTGLIAAAAAISRATTSDSRLMQASTREYTPSNTMEKEPEMMPKQMPSSEKNTVAAMEARSTPASSERLNSLVTRFMSGQSGGGSGIAQVRYTRSA